LTSDYLNVAEYLLADKADGDPCLLTLDGSYTYGELRNATSALAGYLHERGVKKGDRVLLMGENSFFWVAGYLGLLQAGFVCVPVPPSAPPPKVQFYSEHTGAHFALVQFGLLPRIGSALPSENIVLESNMKCGPTGVSLTSILSRDSIYRLPACSTRSSDLAALMFTSGSTRQPQAVMISHGNIRANTESIIEYIGLTSRDRAMVVLPFHYCFGTSLLHTHLRVGGTLVLDSRFMYPEKVLQRMQDTECTGFAGVPSHYRILLDKTSLRKKNFPHLRYVQQAGGHLEAAAIQRLRRALPTTEVFVMYGQTEATARLSFLSPELLDTKLGSIGKGIPGVRLRIENEGRPVQPGEVGEIVAEGENVGQGYWNNPEETARTFQNGRLHTGDMATVDEDGFIRIVSRARDFLKCGGTRISCQQLEQEILAYGNLQEVAVIAVPDDIMGEAVKAFVVPRSNAQTTPEQVKRFCRTRLPFQLVPREIVVLDTLPKNDSGKVLKEQLRALGA
jgi:acyl-CoA synthetase (AMP-forming)/AMP-acid ligase II